jgi:hypothetical protein
MLHHLFNPPVSIFSTNISCSLLLEARSTLKTSILDVQTGLGFVDRWLAGSHPRSGMAWEPANQ